MNREYSSKAASCETAIRNGPFLLTNLRPLKGKQFLRNSIQFHVYNFSDLKKIKIIQCENVWHPNICFGYFT